MLDRERLRSNPNRMIEKNKQGSDKPQPAAPAQGGNPRGKGGRGDRGRGRSRERSESTKGDKICYKFRDGKCDKGKDCPFKHVKEPKPRSGTPKNKKVGERRAAHHQRIENPKKKWPRSLAHTSNREIAGGEANASTNMRRLPPPQRSPKGPTALHQRKSPAQKLRLALLKGMHVLQRERDCQRPQRLYKAVKEQCHRAVVFSSKVEYYWVPATGEQRKVVHRPCVYEKSYPRTDMVPKTDPLVIHRAGVVARQPQEAVKLFGKHLQPSCRFLCTDHEGSVTYNLCRSWIGPKSKVSNTHMPTVATPASPKGQVCLVTGYGK